MDWQIAALRSLCARWVTVANAAFLKGPSLRRAQSNQTKLKLLNKSDFHGFDLDRFAVFAAKHCAVAFKLSLF